MNVIDIVEARRIAEGISVEELCRRAKKVSAASYSRYRSRETKPDHEAAVILLNTVGLKLMAVDPNMRSADNIDKWGTIEMWVKLNVAETLRIFEKVTGINASEKYIKIILASLYYTWFFKTHKKEPSELTVEQIFHQQLQEGKISNELYIWGLKVSAMPTETAYGFYNKLTEEINEYLSHSNIISEITA